MDYIVKTEVAAVQGKAEIDIAIDEIKDRRILRFFEEEEDLESATDKLSGKDGLFERYIIAALSDNFGCDVDLLENPSVFVYPHDRHPDMITLIVRFKVELTLRTKKLRAK